MQRSIVLLLFVFLLSCSDSPEKKFTEGGVSFICPKGWRITEIEKLEGNGFYLNCEKNGLIESAVQTVSWAGDSLDLSETLDYYKASFLDNIIYKNSDLKFKDEVDSAYNGYPSKCSEFSLKLGVVHKGIIHCFYGYDKTITIVKQEAVEDAFKNAEGYKILEETFFSKKNSL